MKTTIRKEIKAKRESLSKERWKNDSQRIFETVSSMREFKNAKVIYCYVDIGHEVETRQLIAYALKTGKEIAVPKIENGSMNFYKIESLDALEPGYFGILEPKQNITPQTPDIVIVPGVAFSMDLERVGYGGGFYDRYLTKDFLKIALAFEFQIYHTLPIEAHDQKVDRIVTEKRMIQ